MAQNRLTRRVFLGGAAAIGGGVALAACTSDGGTKTSTSTSGGAAGLPPVEGGTVVTDPAKFPSKLAESPEFAAQVTAGKLPPVAERIGQDPLVIKPLREIGKYGGEIRRGYL